MTSSGTDEPSFVEPDAATLEQVSPSSELPRVEFDFLAQKRQKQRLAAKMFGVESPPTYFEHYEIGEELGKGGMGIVYAAYDSELNRKVAIKMLHAQADVKLQHRLVHEAQAMAKLMHPNVVTVHEIGQAEGSTFIVMEYVEGVTLRQWLERGRRSLSEILVVFKEAARGLIAAHSKGVVHRDFKPDNVMLGNDGRVRVMDFGLARSNVGELTELEPAGHGSRRNVVGGPGQLTKSGALLGTIAYMSPEQLRGQVANAASDQFGYCIALYEALYGQRPFRGETVAQLQRAMEEGELLESPGNSEVSAWLQKVVFRGLEFRPADRFESMKALLDALEVGELAEMRAQQARTRQIAFIVIASVITIISVVLAYIFRRQRDAVKEQAAELALANGNLGKVELVLEPFDWVDGQARLIPLSELPELTVHLHGLERNDLHLPGDPISDENVRVTTNSIEAPGGTVFLRIDGRGRGEERCAASWLRVMTLPGYNERDTAQPLVVTFPTCQASFAGTVHIPQGEFIYMGPGEPAIQHANYVQPERTVSLQGFFMDRTEVSNALFKMFSKNAGINGYPVPQYNDEILERASEPDSPVTSIDAFEAEAFCRFMGKRLPTEYEWTKAARGGLVVDGRTNAEPRRLYPWGGDLRPECVNQDSMSDGFPWMAPVTAFQCGASPYGVLNLVGNVAEWMAHRGQTDPGPLRIVRGGAVHSPPDQEQVTTVFRNPREARYFDFAIGIRCVADENPEEGSSWQGH